jgi:hypothetical protein
LHAVKRACACVLDPLRFRRLNQTKVQVLGTQPLPWERPNMTKRKVPELRMLRRSVMQLLDRDASKRPTAQQLLVSWNALFEAATNDMSKGSEE